MKNEFVVKYITAWIEVKDQFVNYAYIQMELCSQNLREVIESMNQLSDDRFKTFLYYISCELFKELTECVHYLHSLTPPIIHRDLKPENVLISSGSDGRFLKLCDFGLAKPHKNSFYTNDQVPSCSFQNDSQILSNASIRHTRMIGTLPYMAPEVKVSEKYSEKCDIYSLALIATEIFNFGDDVKQIREKNNL